jgi:predicted metalloendopeptidase
VIGFNSLSGSFSLGLIAGSMYVKKFFNPQAKEAMLEMTSYIRKAFKEDILQPLDWMDESTKKRAVEKLDNMGQFIGYQDEFIDQEPIYELLLRPKT